MGLEVYVVLIIRMSYRQAHHLTRLLQSECIINMVTASLELLKCVLLHNRGLNVDKSIISITYLQHQIYYL
jgi:hypothetical protein